MDQALTFLLAILILVIFVVMPLSGLGVLGKFIVDLVLSLLLVSGALAASRSRMLTVLIFLLTVTGLAIHWTGFYIPSANRPVLDTVIFMACLLAFVIVTFLQVFRPGPINFYRVLAAVSAYLMVGLLWAYAYRLVDMLSNGSLRFLDPPTTHEALMARYVYFSFTTLTTLGYGDVIPIRPAARTLAISEALIGQLYPSILIAFLLGMALQARNLISLDEPNDGEENKS
jgi:hypothetical protein